MNRNTLLLVGALTLIITSCGNGTSANYSDRSTSTVNISSSKTPPDCSGYKSDMIIPHGLTTSTGQLMAGKKFAKIVAVGKDKAMKIMILPPDGESNFVQQFLDEFSDYTLKLIACKKSPSSVMSGFSTEGVCHKIGQINTIGKPTVASADFTSEGFVVDGIKVHATMNLAFNDDTEQPKPDFIMLTADLLNQNGVGDFMIAYANSPYSDCYNR